MIYKLLDGLFDVVRTMNGQAPSEQNGRLNQLLDDDESGTSAEASEEPSSEMIAQELAQAQAKIEDSARRLAVAQEQLAEYATQKEKDCQSHFDYVARLRELLQDCPEPASKQLDILYGKLKEAADEAQSFAAQQWADFEQYKRSSREASLPCYENGVEKRGKIDGELGACTGRGAGADEEEEGVAEGEVEKEEMEGEQEESTQGAVGSFLERAKYIPLRLDQQERQKLRLIEAALTVSEYTDHVDVLAWKSKTGRIHTQIKRICAILSGLLVASNYKAGQRLVTDRNFADNREFFQDVFEVARRHKIMNPEKMRSEYGKLMYLLMDSADPRIQELLEFSPIRPLKTVYSLLEKHSATGMLLDPLMDVATAEIKTLDRHRHQIQADIRRKEKARKTLSQKFRRSGLSEDDLLLCIYSISDNNSFLLFNRDPIGRAIAYLQRFFRPDEFEPGYSLAIAMGREGARLSHSHERQYHYVLQSLTLWHSITNEMFKLWYQAEQDMLAEDNPYHLTDTGQGLNRVQQAHTLSREMRRILAACQRKIGGWVGSSVVHLGDHNVPNALMFIDKYTQVPRILNPVVLVVDQLPQLARDSRLAAYINDVFGSVEDARKTILTDFFRHAFDGSGADNFFDAGSCIDGRLTSAWNWCSKLEKKEYYPLFKLAGFHSFDGDFQK